MPGDSLPRLLDVVRDLLPDVPEQIWTQIEKDIRSRYGAERHYIARSPKKSHLEAMAEIKEQSDCADLARMLGVTVRHARRLKRLSGR